MKRCSKCGEKYADYMQDCPSCNISLENYEKVPISTLLHEVYQKIEDAPIITKISSSIRHCLSTIKMYHITVLYIILIVIVLGSYLVGTFKQYDHSYISATFEKQSSKFDKLTELNKEYDNHKNEKDALNVKIYDIQKQLNSIADFEKKQNDYTAEVQNLSNQVNDLTSQKTQREKTLNDIEYELSQY